MNKFENIIKQTSKKLGIVEEQQPTTINPTQVSNDLEKVMKSVSSTTKQALQSIAGPLDTSTEKDPKEEFLKKLEEFDMESLSNEEKEKVVLSLVKKGLIKQPENNTSPTPQTTNTAENPTSYGV